MAIRSFLLRLRVAEVDILKILSNYFNVVVIMQDLICWQSKFEPCYYSTRLLSKLFGYNKKLPLEKQVNLLEIKKAVYYAKKYHLRHEVVVKSCLSINGSIDKTTGITR